jgi:hypothetical protein
MKKVRIFTLMVLVVFSISCISYAQVFAIDHAKSTERTIFVADKAVIIDSRLSKEEIALLTPELINDINLNDGPIISITQTITNINDDAAPFINEITPMSLIPASQLYLTVVAQRLNSDPTYDYIKFSAVATWNNLPLILLRDSFGIAWSDDFTLYYDYCYVDHKTGSQTKTLSAARQSMTPETGVGYEFSMVYEEGLLDYCITKARLYVYTMKYNETGTANVVAEYAHEYIALLGGSVSMSFSKTPSVSFSASFGIAFNTASPAYAAFNY